MLFDNLFGIVRGALALAGLYILETVGNLVRPRVFLPLTVPQPFQLGVFGLRAEINLRADIRLLNEAGEVVLQRPLDVGPFLLPNRRHPRGVQGRRE
jgi:hypothetical protein